MRLAPKLVCFVLLFVNVSCLPGPDQGAYHFSKTVWATKKGASSPDVKIGEIFFGSDRSLRNANLLSSGNQHLQRPEITTFVGPSLTCQELSIFIFLAQIHFKSTQGAFGEYSESTQMALREHK